MGSGQGVDRGWIREVGEKTGRGRADFGKGTFVGGWVGHGDVPLLWLRNEVQCWFVCRSSIRKEPGIANHDLRHSQDNI